MIPHNEIKPGHYWAICRYNLIDEPPNMEIVRVEESMMVYDCNCFLFEPDEWDFIKRIDSPQLGYQGKPGWKTPIPEENE